MRRVWLDRLADAKCPRPALLLAIQAAAMVKLDESKAHLRRLTLDRREESVVRIEAARALGVLQTAGLENEARTLADDKSSRRIVDRLIAAAILSRHEGEAAKSILLQLAADPEPAVASIAVERLLALDLGRLEPMLDPLTRSADAGLRLLAARALSERKTSAAVNQLASLLDDSNKDVRLLARTSLIRMAGAPSLKEPACRAALTKLSAEGPRGLEQAAIVLGTLEHQPAADRLVPLLTHRAAQVRVASAWALRRLAAPSTADRVLERVRELTEGKPRPIPDWPDEVGPYDDLEHLIEALGVMRHRAADGVLRKYLPRPPIPLPKGAPKAQWLPNLRTAAIWALGRIHADGAPDDLASDLRARLVADGSSIRAMAAVSIGRMKVGSAAPDLRSYSEVESEDIVVRRACAWALGQVTGAPITWPPFPSSTRERWHTGWFIEPIESTGKVGR
jgi:HEAT repeat protein